MSIEELVFETISMMGIRGYNIFPFQRIINIKMMNAKFIEMGQLEQVINISNQDLLNLIKVNRNLNFGIEDDNFVAGKTSFSMIFDHCYNGMTTLVLFGGDNDKLTSKDDTKEYLNRPFTRLCELKTGNNNAFLKANKVSCILILSLGISSTNRTFFDEIPTVEIITETEILSRPYDSCLQSHISTINSEEKNKILFEVGLNENKIPSVRKDDDNLCRILNLKKTDLMISTRRSISEEEIDYSTFIRNIK